MSVNKDIGYTHEGLSLSFVVMSSSLTVMCDAMLATILLLVVVMSLCAIKIVIDASFKNRQTFNKCVSPFLPSKGTLHLLAEDGIMYKITEGKAVVWMDKVVHEVHFGQVAQSCDQQGCFAYLQQENREATDFINSNWSGSVRSQDLTPSVSNEGARSL